MRPPKATRGLNLLIVSAVAFGLLAAGTFVIGLFIFPPAIPPCSYTATHEPFNRGFVHPLWFIFGAIGAMVLGRVLVRWSTEPTGGQNPHLIVGTTSPGRGTGAATHKAPSAAPPAPAATGVTKGVRRIGEVARDVLGPVWVQFAIWVFLLIAVIGLIYETWGVGNDNNPWPVTFLVRCLNNSASIPTWIVTMMVFFVLGSWFLFRDDRGGTSGGV